MHHHMPSDHRLDHVAMFTCCSRRQRDRIALLGTQVRRARGCVLARGGTVVDQVLVILEGDAGAFDQVGGERLVPGDHVGGTEIVERRPHPRTVVAGTDVLLEVYSSAEFRTILHDVPEVASRLQFLHTLPPIPTALPLPVAPVS